MAVPWRFGTGTDAGSNLFAVQVDADFTDVSASISAINTLIASGAVNGVIYPANPGTLTVPVVTGSNTITYETVPIAAGGTGVTSGTALLISQPITVDFSVAGDISIAIKLPSGFTRIGFCSLQISNASADISAANFGLFTTTGGGGTALLPAGTTITVTASTDNTNNNFQSTNCTNIATETYTPIGATLQFRIGTTAASGRTAKVSLRYSPIS